MLVQRVLEYLGPLRGLAWVLLLGVVVLGQAILLGLVALVLCFFKDLGNFLVLGDFLVLVQEVLLHY